LRIIRRFSADVHDHVVGKTAVAKGVTKFAVPSWSAVLATCEKDG